MSRFEDHTRPKPHQAVEAIAARLKTSAALIISLGGLNIYEHEVPADKPASGKWLVVRERIDVGGNAESVSGLVTPNIQVMTESRVSVQTAVAAREWHASVQDTVAGLLIGEDVTVSTGVALLIRRTVRPTAPAYDADDDTRYSTSEYRLRMGT